MALYAARMAEKLIVCAHFRSLESSELASPVDFSPIVRYAQ